MADKDEYYILKCPFCDKDITKVLEKPSTQVICPNCGKDINLYSVFGYNMWLAEKGKILKVNKRPLKDVNTVRQSNNNVVKEEWEDDNGDKHIRFTFASDDYDFDEEAIAEDYYNQSELMQKRPKALDELLMSNSDICVMQYRYLINAGFTRPEAIEIIKKLIEQGFIL